MGIFDRSRSETNLTEETTNLVNTETVGQQDVSGIAGAAGGDLEINIDQVDSGLVAAARDIGGGALAFAGDTVAATLRAQGDTTRDAFGAVTDAVRGALDFGGRSISAVSGLAGDSLAAQNRTVEYALQSNEAVIGKALAATRSDAADILNTSVKYGVIAVGLIAAAFLIPQFMKKAA